MKDRHPSDERCLGCGDGRLRLSMGYCLKCVGRPAEERECIAALIAHVRDHPGISVGDASRTLGMGPRRIFELIERGHLHYT